jgi:hypothetical protein
VHIVPAWRPGLRSRELQTPKLYLTDTGLLAQQLGVNAQRIADPKREATVVRVIVQHANFKRQIKPTVLADHLRFAQIAIKIATKARSKLQR